MAEQSVDSTVSRAAKKLLLIITTATFASGCYFEVSSGSLGRKARIVEMVQCVIVGMMPLLTGCHIVISKALREIVDDVEFLEFLWQVRDRPAIRAPARLSRIIRNFLAM